MRIITLLSDFGLRDTYVAEMKGAILSIYPQASLIDLTHEVPAQDVTTGAYLLRRAIPSFPKGTIHVAVVDPGVGSTRRPLLIEAGGSFLLGPDNGLLLEAASLFEGEPRAFELKNPRYQRESVSAVFHGRDIFAPAAAHLARGVAPEDFGPPADDPVWLPKASLQSSQDAVEGELLLFDRFGNAITSIPEAALPRAPREELEVSIGGVLLRGIKRTYSEVSQGVLLALIGSSGFVEIAVRQGSAEARLPGIGRGTKVVIKRR